jgi:hypothetical protein
MSHEEEDTCMSHEEEDTCMSHEEEDTFMSHEEEDTCMSHEEELINMCLLEPDLYNSNDPLDKHLIYAVKNNLKIDVVEKIDFK